MIERIAEHRAAVLKKYSRAAKPKKKKTPAQKTRKGGGKRAQEPIPKPRQRRDTVKLAKDTRRMDITKPPAEIRDRITPADVTKGFTKGGKRK